MKLVNQKISQATIWLSHHLECLFFGTIIIIRQQLSHANNCIWRYSWYAYTATSTFAVTQNQWLIASRIAGNPFLDPSYNLFLFFRFLSFFLLLICDNNLF